MISPGLLSCQTPFKIVFPLSEEHQISFLMAVWILVFLSDFMTSTVSYPKELAQMKGETSKLTYCEREGENFWMRV